MVRHSPEGAFSAKDKVPGKKAKKNGYPRECRYCERILLSRREEDIHMIVQHPA